MKVMIAGGAGFIGSHLCRKYLDLGAEVICIDNFCTGSPQNITDFFQNPNFKLFEKDIIEPFIQTEPIALNGVEQIFHLASPASPFHYQRLALETALTNTLGTKHLLEIAVQEKSRFIFASTSEIYGSPHEHPQNEKYWGNVNTLGLRSCYDESKRFAETLIMLYQQKYYLDTRIARLFNTYGPSMQMADGRAVPNFIAQALTGKNMTVYGNGEQTRSFCYIDDTVEALYRLANREHLAGEVVNIGNPDEKKIIEIAHRIIALTHSPSKLCFVGLPADDPERRCPDIARAKQLLSWEPEVSLDFGLQKTIDFFQEKIVSSSSE